jgi:histidine triad (HIT) family protein
VLRTGSVFVIPTLRQRPANPGQVIALPAAHVTALHRAEPGLLADLFGVVARLTEAAPAAFGAAGTTMFGNTDAPGQELPHVHVHVVPRFPGDGFAVPDPAAQPAPHAQRAELAARLRQALAERKN